MHHFIALILARATCNNARSCRSWSFFPPFQGRVIALFCILYTIYLPIACMLCGLVFSYVFVQHRQSGRLSLRFWLVRIDVRTKLGCMIKESQPTPQASLPFRAICVFEFT